MALYEGYSADDLNRVLTFSKWSLGILALLTAAAGMFNQWITDRVSTLQKSDKAKSQERLRLTESELEATKIKTAELTQQLAPRSLTDNQQAVFFSFVENKPKGRVTFACAGNDKEASAFTIIIQDLLTKAGYDVAPGMAMFISTGSGAIGIRMTIKNPDHQPPHAATIQKGFEAIGIPAPISIAASISPIDDNSVTIYVGSK